jgi:hypothetical protein
VISVGNTTVDISPASAGNVTNWTVDTISQLFQETFFYRIGATGPQFNLNTLPFTETLGLPIGTSQTDTVLYTGAGFTIQIAYGVTGGTAGSHISDIAEGIHITNTGNAPIDFHFFEYSDFDLGGTAGGDTVSLLNPFVWRQSGDGFSLSETSGVPAAQRCEDAFFASTLTSLTGGNYNLANANGLCGTVGPGDVTWAWQWDPTIAAGGGFIISKDKTLAAGTPEPGSLMLLGLGLASLAAFRRKRA